MCTQRQPLAVSFLIYISNCASLRYSIILKLHLMLCFLFLCQFAIEISIVKLYNHIIGVISAVWVIRDEW